MGRKKSKNNQSSNTPIHNGDSSDSNEVNGKKAGGNCVHVPKSVEQNQVLKSLKNGEDLKKNFCQICVKLSKPLKGTDIYICLKCGTKTCCREHSHDHFSAPRSGLHALAYDFHTQTVWCFSCSCEINDRDVKHKKLLMCVTLLNRQMNSFILKDTPSNVEVPEKIDEVNNKNENVQDGKKEKKMHQKPKPGERVVSQSVAPVRGLSNLGNTCYFNSVMQCLARTQSLLVELKEMDHRTDVRLELKGGETLEGSLDKWDAMSECLYETLTSLLVPGSVYVPTKFLNFVRKRHSQFEGHDQHDAHELLRHTLDCIKMNDLRRYRCLMLAKKGLSQKVDPKEVPDEIHKQMKELEHKVTQVQTFIPENTFKGKLVSRVKCQACQNSSEYIEGFLDLSLPVLADKPHPPVSRRRSAHSSGDNILDEQNNNEDSPKRHALSAKQRRIQRRLEAKKNRADKPAEGLQVDEVAVEAQEAMAEKPEETLELDEDKPHESGYSSEKASSSLRGSPSSEGMRSSSPCDNSWATVPQLTDSWLSCLPDVIQLPPQPFKESIPDLVNRLPTHIPLHSDGTPNLAHLSLHDSDGSTLNPLCLDTDIIMEREPDWRNRIHETYFSSSLETENNHNLGEMKICDAQDLNCEEPGQKGIQADSDDRDACSNVSKDTHIIVEAVNSSPEGLLSSIGAGRLNCGLENAKLPGHCPQEVSNSRTRHGDSFSLEQPLDEMRKLVSSDLTRSVSPPFRKFRTSHFDSDFSPVKEEESEAVLDQSEFEPMQEADCIKPLSEEKNSAENQQEVIALTETKESLALPFTTSIAEWYQMKLKESQSDRDFRSEDNEELQYLGMGCSTENSVFTKPGFEGNPASDDKFATDDWSTFHHTFNASQNNCSLTQPGDHTEPSMTVHNNSLDSEGNESGNEKSMNTCSEEFHDELLPDDSLGQRETNLLEENSTNHLEGKIVENNDSKAADDPLNVQFQESVEEGDFEPLLSTVQPASKSPTQSPKEDLNVFFDEMKETMDSLQKRNDNREANSLECSVESCLRQFTTIEFLTGNNKVGCSACTERQNKGAIDGKTVLTMASKQLLIGQAPPVLILHLKRFQVQLHSFRKLSKHVSFPLILDLAPFCTSIGETKNKVNDDHPMPYVLYGIVEHRGSLNSGHYVAYVKTEDTNGRRWFCISDSHVDEVTEERVLKTEAYLLFYSRIKFPSPS